MRRRAIAILRRAAAYLASTTSSRLTAARLRAGQIPIILLLAGGVALAIDGATAGENAADQAHNIGDHRTYLVTVSTAGELVSVRTWNATAGGPPTGLGADHDTAIALANPDDAQPSPRLLLAPAAAMLRQVRAWHAPLSSIPTLLATILIGALLLLVLSYRARIEELTAMQAGAQGQTQAGMQQAELLRRLAESNVIGIAVNDRAGHIHDANDAFLDMLGYTREDLARGYIRWDDLTPPEYAAQDWSSIAQIMQTGVALTWEKEYIRKDGARVPVMIGGVALDGLEDRQVSIVTDLTKIKQTEAELKRRTTELENYKLIVNSVPIAIGAKEYSAKRHGAYFLLNPKARAVTGIGDRELGEDEEVNDAAWLGPEAVERLRQQDLQILASGEPMISEERLIDARTGTTSWYLATKVPLLDPEGVPYALAVITQDVTAHRQLAERQTALINAIPDVMFRLSSEGVYRDVKNSRSVWLLADPEQIIGTSILEDPLPKDVQQRFMAAIRAAIHTNVVQKLEYDLESPQGVRHYEARVVKSGHDEIVALVRDITDATRTRAALEEANERLRLANTELSEFASVVSHDLKEPLHTVRSFAELLARYYDGAFDEKGQKWLAFIVSGAQRMNDLIDNLLTYSRVGREGATEMVDTGMLLDEILEDSRASIEAAGAEIEVGPLPALMSNRTDLRQVFQNLVSNALKFRRPEVTPHIAISAKPAGRGWAFTVEDNGIGIDPEHHERIFQVFQRLHTREEYPGTGIGLALVKKIIERQGGEITVLSVVGEGTTFHFMLPQRPRLRAPG